MLLMNFHSMLFGRYVITQILRRIFASVIFGNIIFLSVLFVDSPPKNLHTKFHSILTSGFWGEDCQWFSLWLPWQPDRWCNKNSILYHLCSPTYWPSSWSFMKFWLLVKEEMFSPWLPWQPDQWCNLYHLCPPTYWSSSWSFKKF